MQKFKRLGFMVTMAMMGFALMTGKALAYSDVYFSGMGSIIFSGSGANTGSTFYFDAGLVSSATSPWGGVANTFGSDPVVGKWVNFFDAGTTTKAVFTLGSNLGGSVWSLGDQTAAISVSNLSSGGGTKFFSGPLIAKTIDFATGIITWGTTTTTATINSAVNSNILGLLSNSDNDPHYAAISSMAFDVANLSTWLTTGGLSGESDAAYAANITVTPEPGEWALILMGLGLIGFSIYRKNPRFELARALDFRMS
jgi:hypothetical protein